VPPSPPAATHQDGAADAAAASPVTVEAHACAVLQERRPRDFRLSVPAAPLRLSCRMLLPEAVRHTADLCRAHPLAVMHVTSGGSASVVDTGADECHDTKHAVQLPPVDRDTLHTPASPSAEHGAEACSVQEVRDVGHGADDLYRCARMNAAVVAGVLRKLPHHTRELYHTSPLRLCFGEDIQMGSAAEAAAAELAFEPLAADCGPPIPVQRGGAADGASDAACDAPAAHACSTAGQAEVECLGKKGTCLGSAERLEGESAAGGGGMRVRSPVHVSRGGDAGEGGVLTCTVMSEAQAFEYILYGSQRGAEERVAEGCVLARAAGCGVPVTTPEL